MGVAAELARTWLSSEGARLGSELRDQFERAVCEATGAVVHGAGSHRLWNTTNLGFVRLEAEAILLLLSERGVDASAGAACSSGSLDPSPVLLAMGVAPDIAHGSIRFSLSRETTESEITEASRRVIVAIDRLRSSTSAAVS
jgi:cysteine desulfurase